MKPVKTLDQLNREHVVRVLDQCGRRKKTAAKLLGIGIRTLQIKLEKWGLKERYWESPGSPPRNETPEQAATRRKIARIQRQAQRPAA